MTVETDGSKRAAIINELSTPEWQIWYLQPLLVSLLAVSLALGALVFLRQVFPGIAWMPALPLSFAVALEGALTTWWLEHKRRLSNVYLFRLGELLTLLLIFWLVWIILLDFGGNFQNLIQAIGNQEFRWASGGFIGIGLVCAFAWERSISIAAIFSRMALTKIEINTFTQTLSDNVYDDEPVTPEYDRSLLLKQYSGQWIGGGVLLLIFVALSSVDLPSYDEAMAGFNLRHLGLLGIQQELLVALLLYFLTGFWLLSQARIGVMRARWLYGRITPEEGLASRWQRHVFLSILLIALISSLLPIGSTLAISRVLQAVVGLGILLWSVILGIMSLPLTFIFSLLPSVEEPAELPSLDFDDLSQYALPQSQINPTVSLVLSVITGAIAFVVAVAAVYLFLREREIKPNLAPLGHILRALRGWLCALFFGARRVSQRLVGAVLRQPESTGIVLPALPNPWRFIRLGGLSPREQLRYFYLSILRRAGEQGVRRAGNETPLEHARVLKDNWPDMDDEFDELTGAFLSARYGRTEISKEQTTPARSAWNRIRGFLKKVKREKPD